MPTYTVVSDGEWQGDFESLHVAYNWARALGETGPIVYLTIKRGESLNLVTALPERRAGEGPELWMREARHWCPSLRREAEEPIEGTTEETTAPEPALRQLASVA